jgi:PAS domain S-box-containing protein
MNTGSPGRPRTVAIAIAGGVTLVMALAALYAATIRLVERVTVASLRSGVRVVAAQFREDMDEISEHLRQLAIERSFRYRNEGDVWRDEADRVRQGHARRMRSLLLADETGKVRWATPDQAWLGGQEAAVTAVVREAQAAGSVVFGDAVAGSDGSRLLLAAVPAPSREEGADEEGLVLVGAVDVGELADELIAELAGQSGGLAFLASPKGRLFEVVEYVPGSTTQAVRLRAGDVAWLSELIEGDKSLPDRFTASLHGTPESLLAVSGPARVGSSNWTIGVLVPRPAIMREAQPFILGGGITVLILLAFLIAGAVGMARTREASAVARREIERWRRMAEGAEREGRVRVAADDSREPAVFLRDMRVVGANLAAARALEAGEVADLVGRSVFDFVPADERPRLERFLVGRVAGANVPEQFQTRLTTARGGRRLVEMVTSLVDREGTVVEHVTWRDVTSRERAEALLRAVSGSVQASLALCDPEGQLVWANSVFSEQMRASAERFLGRSLLPVVAPTDRRRVGVLFGRAKRGRPDEGRVSIVPLDGRPALLSVRAMPVQVAGELFGVLFVGNDITDREREVEREVRTVRGEVLAGVATSVAHRLNNDFQALLGILERTKQEKGVGPIKGDVEEIIASAAGELHRFVLLARTGPTSMRPLRLGGLVDRWSARVGPTLPAGVRMGVRRDVADDRVVGDEDQIELVLDLALAAAGSAVQAGGGAIEVSLEQAGSAERVRLAVSDTGEAEVPARPADDQVGSPLLPVRDLAAAVAAVVAQRHEGVSGSRQRAGIGQRIWLDLPLRVGAAPDRAPERRSPRSGVILVADDEDLVRASLASALREQGYEVVETGDGGTVVEKVLADPAQFALVVLDLVMPVMDGREVLRRLREACPEVPVLVSTGYEPSGDEGLAGAELLIKPFSLEEFVHKVRELLAGQGERGTENGTMTQ